MKVLVWIVFAMILYDWSIHLIFLFGKEDIFLDRGLNYWPEWKDKNKSKLRYQQFWSLFWGTALLLLLVYLLNT
jgi:hypothetical protein